MKTLKHLIIDLQSMEQNKLLSCGYNMDTMSFAVAKCELGKMIAALIGVREVTRGVSLSKYGRQIENPRWLDRLYDDLLYTFHSISPNYILMRLDFLGYKLPTVKCSICKAQMAYTESVLPVCNECKQRINRTDSTECPPASVEELEVLASLMPEEIDQEEIDAALADECEDSTEEWARDLLRMPVFHW